MKPDRLNAFTDGVIAIIITIMVLEIRLPEQATWSGVKAMAPFLGIYALSFINIGIFWNNHHHMMQAPRKIDGKVLWANLSLLFWLSLVPYVIRWMGEAGIVAWPVAAYGGVLMMAVISYMLLERALIAAGGEAAAAAIVSGSRVKEWLSFATYAAGFVLAFMDPLISVALYVSVSLAWFIPERRYERNLQA